MEPVYSYAATITLIITSIITVSVFIAAVVSDLKHEGRVTGDAFWLFLVFGAVSFAVTVLFSSVMTSTGDFERYYNVDVLEGDVPARSLFGDSLVKNTGQITIQRLGEEYQPVQCTYDLESGQFVVYCEDGTTF